MERDDEDREDALPTVKVLQIEKNPIFILLDRRFRFFEQTQHDHQKTDWDGRRRQAHGSYFDDRWLEGQKHGWVDGSPYGERRPDTPMPIGAQIVSEFTDALLGEDLRPKVSVPTDDQTSGSVNEILTESGFWSKAQRARDLAGSQGAVMFSLAVLEGRPVVRVHDARFVVVLEWEEGVPEWIPKRAIEQKPSWKFHLTDEGVQLQKYWKTKLWAPEGVYLFEDVPDGWDPEMPIPLASTEDGAPAFTENVLDRPALVWHQNVENADDPYGVPDYAGTYELQDKSDRLQSQLAKASIANADPTPVYKTDRTRRSEIEIGTGNAVKIGANEELSFLEMTGEAINIGWTTLEKLREQIRQRTGATLPEEGDIGKQQSGDAIEKRGKRFKNKVSRLRTPFGQTTRKIAEMWIEFARELGIGRKDEESSSGILLDPLVEKENDEKGQTKKKIGAYEIGKGRVVKVTWPAFDHATPEDISQTAQAFTAATGAKKFMSRETATLRFAEMNKVEDPREELKRIEEEEEKTKNEMAEGQFPFASTPPGSGKPPEDDEEEEDEDEDEDDNEEEGEGDEKGVEKKPEDDDEGGEKKPKGD